MQLMDGDMEEETEIKGSSAEEEEAEWSEEERKEGVGGSGGSTAISTIHKLKVCCDTMMHFHQEGMEIKDIAAQARSYINELVGDRDIIDVDVNKNKSVIVVDLMEDEGE